MAQFYWPPVSISGSSNPQVGANGQAAPTSSAQSGGVDSNGNLQPIKVGTDGTQIVSLSGTSPITGHVIVDSGTISQIAAGTVTLNGTPAVAVASGTLGLVSSVTNLASGTVTLNGAPAISGTVAVSNFPGTQPISGAVTITSGTISQIAAGTISSITSGTVTLTGTPSVAVASGTISSLSQGTVTISGTPNIGSIAVTPAAGTVSQAALTVGTAAVLLVVSGTAVSSNRTCLVVTPDASSTAKFYFGGSTVTPTSSTRGAQLVGGQPLIINNDASPYYICSDTAAQTVYITETTK